MQNAMVLPRTGQQSLGQSSYPLAMAAPGTPVQILKIKGNDETRRFLAGLGFVEGVQASVVCEAAGNMIVEVKGARIALSQQMALRVMVG